MASAIQMPKLSDTMTEGKIQRWLVREGQAVKAGDPIAEIETDKATLEMEAYEAGTILKLLAADGGTAPVGGTIAVVGKPGEDWRSAAGTAAQAPAAAATPAAATPAAATPAAGSAEPAAEPARAQAAAPTGPAGAVRYEPRTTPGEIPGLTYGFGHGIAPPVPAAPRRPDGEKVRASPLARKLAAEKGLDLQAIDGSGPGGRITRADVEEARPGGAPVRQLQAVPSRAPEILPMSQMRKAIARSMQQAKRDIPHFYLTLDVDMGPAQRLRAEAKAGGVAFSVGDLVHKAVAVAALEIPRVQATLRDDQTYAVPREVNLGFAVALEDGLITPVIRGADRMSIGQLARAAKELAGKAREKKLKPDEYQGATITVSNLGMYGIEHFYAIINPPQSSIVSVGKLREEPVVAQGQVVVGHRMRLGYAGDHRVVDGAVGAQFLQALARILENPLALLIG